MSTRNEEQRPHLSEAECRDRIRRCPSCQDWGRDIITAIGAEAPYHACAKGQTILAPCDREGALFLVAAGSAYLCDLMEDGNEVILRRFGKDELFGLTFPDPHVVPGDFADIYVRAGCKGAEVVRVCLDRVRAAMVSNPDFAPRLVAAQANSMNCFARNELRLMHGSIRRKLASLLLDLAADDPRGRVHETHEELAQMIGTTRQQVTEVLCAFRRERLIAYERCGSIEILAAGQGLRGKMSRI